jgi:hypothetical protein
MVSSEKQTSVGKIPVLEMGGSGRAVLPQLYALLYGGDVGTKLAVAEKLFRFYREELKREPLLAAGLSSLSSLHDALQQQMLAMGMDRTCARCAQGSGGGCCSMTIAAETDVVQLLLNMLAGVAVFFRRSNNPDCCYLGENGCIFLFKPMFCLNYVCGKIVACEKLDNLQILEEKTGILLQAQQDLEKTLIEFFKARASAVSDMLSGKDC